jgi:ribonuclease HI
LLFNCNKRSKWRIEFSRGKAHVGIYGDELADRIAKDAARNKETKTAFNRIPKLHGAR